MKLAKSASRLAQYLLRLKKGKADRIKLNHLDKVLKSLDEKRAKVSRERSKARGGRKERLDRKLMVIENQIKRAKWLRKEITIGR